MKASSLMVSSRTKSPTPGSLRSIALDWDSTKEGRRGKREEDGKEEGKITDENLFNQRFRLPSRQTIPPLVYDVGHVEGLSDMEDRGGHECPGLW